MLALLPAVALAALAPLASALTITQPTASGWVGNTTVTVAWDWSQDDPNFSIELGNTHLRTGALDQGPIAVANNINPNINSLEFALPVLPADSKYFLAFVAVDDVNTVYANTSFLFPITSNPTSSSVTHTSTLGSSTPPTSTKSSTVAKTTMTNSTSSLTTSLTVTTTSSSTPFTTLAITTLNTSSAAPTSTKGAATRVEAAWYVTFAAAILGTVFA